MRIIPEDFCIIFKGKFEFSTAYSDFLYVFDIYPTICIYLQHVVMDHP